VARAVVRLRVRRLVELTRLRVGRAARLELPVVALGRLVAGLRLVMVALPELVVRRDPAARPRVRQLFLVRPVRRVGPVRRLGRVELSPLVKQVEQVLRGQRALLRGQRALRVVRPRRVERLVLAPGAVLAHPVGKRARAAPADWRPVVAIGLALGLMSPARRRAWVRSRRRLLRLHRLLRRRFRPVPWGWRMFGGCGLRCWRP
jgi:hypothetical protein